MQEKKKSSKTLWIVLAVILLAIAGGIAGTFFYLTSTGKFMSNAFINGHDVSDKTPEEIFDMLDQQFQTIKVVVKEQGNTDLENTLSEYGFYLDRDRTIDVLNEALHIQNKNPIELGISLFTGRDFRIDLPCDVNDDIFTGLVKTENLMLPRVISEDAKLTRAEDGTYVIVPETYGNEVDNHALQLELKRTISHELVNAGDEDSYLKKGTLEVEFPEELYQKPQILSTDADLNIQMNAYNKFCLASISYVFGSQREILNWDTIQQWIYIENGEGKLNTDYLYEFAADLATRYNTRYHTRTFTTTYGNTITIEDGKNEYGYTVNQDAEVSTLYDNIIANAPVEREPVYYKTNDYDNPLYYHREGYDDLAGTYVEVNLSAQHLWFYKNGALIVESDFVSGCVAKGHETITGVYPLAYKKSPDVLVGSNANDGYRTPVDYWMPFNEGQGLHDASWRSSFGGSIYQNSGSHGCVNLPNWAAAQIYNNIDAGVPIIVFK